VDLPRRDSIALDWNVAAVVIAVGFLLGLIAAAVPAIWAARVSLAALLSTSAVRGGAGSSRMRRGLIVVQVALSLVLLSTGGLVVRSFERLLVADPGFRPEGVLTFNLGLFGGVFPKNAEVYAFLDQLDAALRAVPGVIGVSTTTELPLSGGIKGDFVEVPGAPGNSGDRERDRRTVRHIFTRAGYIKTLGIRLVEGREFEATDRGAGREVMIDRALARHFFPNGSPIGATLKGEGGAMTIVGVFEQARLRYLYKDDDNPHIFVRADEYETGSRPTYYVVRTEMDPLSLLPEVRAAIRRIDRRITISNVRTMDEIVADARSKERVSAILIAGLALGALLLVAMGLFGVISGSVARRRGELAVRMALGATHGRVIRLVVGEGARLVALGLVIGIPGVDMAGEAIRGLLIDVSPFDVPTIITVTIGLIVVSLLACYLAARRVTAIEPERLLREG
jgi:putative ABC transport system permease protein